MRHSNSIHQSTSPLRGVPAPVLALCPPPSLLVHTVLGLPSRHRRLEGTQLLLLGSIVRHTLLIEGVLRRLLELLVDDVAHLVLTKAGVLRSAKSNIDQSQVSSDINPPPK